MIDLLEKLIKDKELVIQDGVKLVCGAHINVTLSRSSVGSTLIFFNSPFVYIVIEKLGSINIMDIKRKIDSIEITNDSYTIKIDNFPDITKKRDGW